MSTPKTHPIFYVLATGILVLFGLSFLIVEWDESRPRTAEDEARTASARETLYRGLIERGTRSAKTGQLRVALLCLAQARKIYPERKETVELAREIARGKASRSARSG